MDPQQLMQALMGGGPNLSSAPPSGFATDATDPFTALLSSMGAPDAANDAHKSFPSNSSPPSAPETVSRSQRFMPLFRLLSTIAMVMFFVFYLEPLNFTRMERFGLETPSRWGRWAELARRKTDDWGVQPVVGLSLITIDLAFV